MNAKVFTHDVFMVCSRDGTPPSKLFMCTVLFVTQFGQINVHS